MKKILMIICALTCMSFILSACSPEPGYSYGKMPLYTGFNDSTLSDEKYDVFLLSGTEPLFGVESGEYVIADYEKFADIVPNESEKITVLGQTIVGKYSDTIHPSNAYSPRFRYEADNFSFALDVDGNLCYFSDYNVQSNDTNKELSQKEYLEIAENFISSLNIVDITQYRTSVEKLNNGSDCYKVSFVKYIGDFKTEDYAYVYITYDGQVEYYNASRMFGLIPSDLDISGIDKDVLQSSIANKLNELCGNVKSKYPYIGFENEHMGLTILKEGNIGIIYAVGVNMATAENVPSANGGRFSMVIVID